MTTTEAPEFKIECDYDNRLAHARSMYHMAIQAAESELDGALAVADDIRRGELSDARRTALSAVQEAPGPAMCAHGFVIRDSPEGSGA